MAELSFDDLPQAQGQGQSKAGIDFSDLPEAAKPGAPQGALENFGQGAALGGGAAVTGINRGLGIIGDTEVGLQGLADQYLPAWIARPGGGATALKAGPAPHIFPTSADYQRATDELGLTGHEWEKPQNAAQRFVGEGISGATSALPTALLGPEAAILPAMGQGASGGLAAEGAREAGLPPVYQAAAGAIGGGATQLVQHIAQGNPVLNTAKLLGGASTLQEAGEHLQADARQWRNDIMPVKIQEAWAPVDAQIGPNAPVPLTNFQSALDDITKSGGSLAPIVGQLTPALADKLKIATTTRMTPQGPPGSQGPVIPPTWQEVQTLRSAVGNAMTTPSVVESIGQKSLDKMYAGLSSDMRDAAANVSPEAAQALDKANETSQGLYQLASGPISKIISDPNAKVDPKIRPEQAAQRLLAGGKSGATDIDQLQQSIPKAIGQLASAQLQINPQGWAKMAPETQKALVPNQILQSVLAKALPANPVNFTKALQGGAAGGVLGPEGAIALGHALGSTLDPVTTGALGGLALGGLMTSGELYKAAKNNPEGFVGALRGTVGSGASNALAPEGKDQSPLITNALTPP